MIPDKTFKNPHTDQDLATLKKLLKTSLHQAGAELSLQKPDLNILDLACGRADEAKIITDAFGAQSKRTHLTGIDIRDREIGYAKERWADIGSHVDSEFIVHDGAKLGDLKTLSDDFDVAFMRHQNFWDDPYTWQKIYTNAMERLNQDGLLVITSYFDREHALALAAIKKLGGELLDTTRNQASRKLEHGENKSVDRHIAIFKKAKLTS